MNHIDSEEQAGRPVHGDWSWLVPPMSASACPVFHRSFDPAEIMPNYVHQQLPWHSGASSPALLRHSAHAADTANAAARAGDESKSRR
jgi:hypothetical protein